MKKTLLAVLGSLSLALHASALITLTVDERGNGDWDGSPLFPAATLSPDPGPGGLASALTFYMGNANPPFGQTIGTATTGDLLVLAPGSSTLLELIRFRPGSIFPVPSPSAFVWYSAPGPVPFSLADTGFPSAQNANRSILLDPGYSSGLRIIQYTPTPGQPGFVNDLANPGNALVKYQFLSQVPEPATAALAGTFALLLLVARRNRRHVAATNGQNSSASAPFPLPRRSVLAELLRMRYLRR